MRLEYDEKLEDKPCLYLLSPKRIQPWSFGNYEIKYDITE
jgi:hypothetical protein